MKNFITTDTLLNGWQTTPYYNDDNLPNDHTTFFNNLFDNKDPTKKPIRVKTKSVWGTVFLLQNKNKYVAKIQSYIDKKQLQMILDEINTTTLPNIDKVSIRCIGFNISDYTTEFLKSLGVKSDTKKPKRIAIIILDHVERGNPSVKSLSIYDYFVKTNFITIQKKPHKQIINSCPTPYHPLYKQLYKTLLAFYKITGRIHGDLHSDNIVVIYNKNTTNHDLFTGKSIIDVVIYDFGSIVKVSSQTFNQAKNLQCLDTILNLYKQNLNQYATKKPVLVYNKNFPKKKLDPQKMAYFRFNKNLINNDSKNGGVWHQFGFKPSKTKKTLKTHKIASVKF